MLKSLSIYTISSFANAGLPFLLLPVLTKYLSVEEYGLLAIIQIFITLTAPFITVNIASTLQLEYHNLNRQDFASLVSSVLIIPIISFVLVLFFYMAFRSTIDRFLEISSDIWLFAIPFIAFMQVLPQTVLSIYQISEKPFQYAKFQLSLTFINFIFTIIFVVLLTYGWEGRLLAVIVSYTLFSILGFYLLFKQGLLNFNIEKKYILEALKIGMPLIVHVISGALFLMSDRLFISYFLGNGEVGIYSVGAQIAMIALIMQQSFNQAWVPYLFKNLKADRYTNDIKIVKISYMAFAFFLILPFLIEIISHPIFSLLIDKKFAKAADYVFWIALGYGFLGMYKVVTNYIVYEKKTSVLSILTFSSLLLNLVLNYFFIQTYGAIGVAYATAVTIGFFFIVVFYVANRFHKMPWLYFWRSSNETIH